MKHLKSIFIIALFIQGFISAKSQNTDANVFGDVKCNGEHIHFASIIIEGTTRGTTTDETGHYMLINLPEGTHVLVASFLGYTTEKKTITVVKGKSQEVNFELKEETMVLSSVVVTEPRLQRGRPSHR